MNDGLIDGLHGLRNLLKEGKTEEAHTAVRKLIVQADIGVPDEAAVEPAGSDASERLGKWLSAFLDTDHNLLLSHLDSATDDDIQALDWHVESRREALEIGLQVDALTADITRMYELLGEPSSERDVVKLIALLGKRLRQHLLDDEALRMEVSELSRTMAISLGKLEQLLHDMGDDTSELEQARKILGEALPTDISEALKRLNTACAYLLSADKKLHSATATVTRQMQDNMQEVRKLRGHLQKAQAEARRDVLTGLPNRLMLQEYFSTMSEDEPACLLMLDLDHFKQINDTHGHDVGDEVLTAIGLRLAHRLRQGDVIARVGGEEFAAVLVGVGGKRAYKVADDLRQALASEPVATTVGELDVTTSVGVAVRRWQEGVDEWMKRADRALYEAKNEGRNRTKVSVM